MTSLTSLRNLWGPYGAYPQNFGFFRVVNLRHRIIWPCTKEKACPMAMRPGRSEERSAAAVAVMLTSPEPSFPTELTITENISSRGARVVTKGRWEENDSLVIKSLEGDLQSEARVIYRRPVREDVYAIGLELSAPWGDWRQK